MARPTKLTPEIQHKITEAVRAGNYMETAASFAGISKTTLFEWMRRGAREDEGIYHEFSNAMDEALAEAEVMSVAVILRAAQNQWQAAAWWCERKFPERWGRKDRHEHTGPGGGPIAHEHRALFADGEPVFAAAAELPEEAGSGPGEGSPVRLLDTSR